MPHLSLELNSKRSPSWLHLTENMPFSCVFCHVSYFLRFTLVCFEWKKTINGHSIVELMFNHVNSVAHMALLLLCLHRLQDWAMLHPGQQPDVPGPAQRNHLHQNSVLRNHWSGVGPPLWAVPRPATPLQERIHPQHSHWSVPRSDWTNTQWCLLTFWKMYSPLAWMSRKDKQQSRHLTHLLINARHWITLYTQCL